MDRRRRVAVWVSVTIAYVAAEVALLTADPGSEDDPWASILALAVPLAAGLLIGRWWALALSLVDVPAYAIDPSMASDLAPWFVLTAGTLLNAIAIAFGVGLHRLTKRRLGKA